MVTTSGTTPNRTVSHLYDRRVLDPRADDDALVRAAAENQTEWLVRVANAAGGGVHRAREMGCAVATLNATPDGALPYRTLGFRSVGVAQTWWR